MKVEFPKVNNKLAFFDFDRTLVAHSYSREYMAARQDGYLMECYWALTMLKEEHTKDRALPCMQWYTKKLFDEGYGLYCLTHEIFNLHGDLKQEQLKTFYPGLPMTYLEVNSPEHKVDMIKAVALVEDCPLSDIIFVDDLQSTVALALDAGIDAHHLSDIVVMYESKERPQEQDMMIRAKDLPLKQIPDLNDTIARAEQEMMESMGPDLSEKSLCETYEECRRLAEMNGRGLERKGFI